MAPTPGCARRLWLLLPLLSGCAGMPVHVESRSAPLTARGVVFVVDGAGGRQSAARSLAAAVDQARLPLHVRSFEWTHGRRLALADVVDVAHSRRQGRLLAEEVCRWQAARPGVPVYLVGYSAGCAVALAAAEQVPADSLERVVLLAPAVSACYDLDEALAGARGGIDVFSSQRDTLWLGLGTGVVGTADGRRGPAAGRVGFCPPAGPLAGRLRQHPWDPFLAWTGNEGGHGGPLKAGYLRAYVLPLLGP
jgi:pimeloyl-ACP methyl ester carboxylesterase